MKNYLKQPTDQKKNYRGKVGNPYKQMKMKTQHTKGFMGAATVELNGNYITTKTLTLKNRYQINNLTSQLKEGEEQQTNAKALAEGRK